MSMQHDLQSEPHQWCKHTSTHRLYSAPAYSSRLSLSPREGKESLSVCAILGEVRFVGTGIICLTRVRRRHSKAYHEILALPP